MHGNARWRADFAYLTFVNAAGFRRKAFHRFCRSRKQGDNVFVCMECVIFVFCADDWQDSLRSLIGIDESVFTYHAIETACMAEIDLGDMEVEE